VFPRATLGSVKKIMALPGLAADRRGVAAIAGLGMIVGGQNDVGATAEAKSQLVTGDSISLGVGAAAFALGAVE
jgi:hypothetical protein